MKLNKFNFFFIRSYFMICALFQVLLANKLDGDISLNYTTVAMPLLVSHVTLIFMSFSAKGGNRCEKVLQILMIFYYRYSCVKTMDFSFRVVRYQKRLLSLPTRFMSIVARIW